MKRLALVSYSSSSEDNDEPLNPPPKKRKLPPLASALVVPTPVDNPALHQGRIRTIPHVEGQFAAHIYVALHLERNSHLHKLVDEVLERAREIVPTLSPMGKKGNGEGTEYELHISLSRPTFLRAHQRDVLKRAVKTAAHSSSPFVASFASFSELTNDEKTRTFLTLEVGAGHSELKALSECLTPTLQSIRQKEFYPEPRFHASIAWALLDPAQQSAIDTAPHSSQDTDSLSPPLADTTPEAFPTIPRLPESLVHDLNRQYGDRLTAKAGRFDVDGVKTKIGKDVFGWHLAGS
ncbi:hypothetical protein PLICRDRAFT_142946 [Plicaturopsis crispa FD-325 SS-3]|nr:hypothetical protein PLICRDRAFT_142946 [Plicaturopsis crispa FD-325 SS-3]